MSMWELYLLTRLEPLNTFILTVVWLSGAVLVITTLIYMADSGSGYGDEKLQASMRYYRNRSFWIVIAFSLGLTFLPTTKDMAIVFGGYWVTNNKEVAKLPENVVKTVNSFLEKYQGDKDEQSKASEDQTRP